MTCGIYLLRFNNTDKVYIGLSENIERRWSSHKYSFLNKTVTSKLLEAYESYGMPVLEILCECMPEELTLLEKEAIEIFNSVDNGFNSREGGACGGGIGVSGQFNGRSRYSNKIIEEAFNLLIYSDLTHVEIAKKLNISKEVVGHISDGSGHAWLKEKYPEQYAKLINTKRIVHNKFNPIYLINSQTNERVYVTSYLDIQNITGCAYSTAVCLVSGALSNIFNMWNLEIPVTKTKVKKPVYTLKHVYTEEITTVYSKLAFFTDRGLTNRNKFSEFLKSGVLGSVYQDWILLSIG